MASTDPSRPDSTESSPFVPSAYAYPAANDRWAFFRSRRRRLLFAICCIVVPALFLFSQPLLLQQDNRQCVDPLDIEALRSHVDTPPQALPPTTVTVTASPALPPTPVTVTAPAVTETVTLPQPLEPVKFALVMYYESAATEGAVLMKVYHIEILNVWLI